jgi:hypothetical protein
MHFIKKLDDFVVIFTVFMFLLFQKKIFFDKKLFSCEKYITKPENINQLENLWKAWPILKKIAPYSRVVKFSMFSTFMSILIKNLLWKLIYLLERCQWNLKTFPNLVLKLKSVNSCPRYHIFPSETKDSKLSIYIIKFRCIPGWFPNECVVRWKNG